MKVILVLALGLVAQIAQAQEADCGEKWQRYYDTSSVGEYTVMASHSETRFGGNVVISDSEITDEVIGKEEASILKRITIVTNGQSNTSESAVEKDQFIAGCENPNEGFEVIDEGEGEVTVPAGTFMTRWMTYQLTEGQETIGTSWNHETPSGDYVQVKAQSESNFPGGSTTYYSELIETNKD